MGCAGRGITWSGMGGAGDGRFEACFFWAEFELAKTPHFDWAVSSDRVAPGKEPGGLHTLRGRESWSRGNGSVVQLAFLS